jgi:hypothetical protein
MKPKEEEEEENTREKNTFNLINYCVITIKRENEKYSNRERQESTVNRRETMTAERARET